MLDLQQQKVKGTEATWCSGQFAATVFSTLIIVYAGLMQRVKHACICLELAVCAKLAEVPQVIMELVL
jgi:hypothetical protein